MLDDLYRDIQHLLQSRYLSYALAGVFIVLWWIASRVVGLVQRLKGTSDERPRRRLPLG